MNNTTEYPEKLEIEITEEDRQKAGDFWCNQCLIATAATRLGFKVISIGCEWLCLKDADYQIEGTMNSSDVHYIGKLVEPHYHHNVVGKKFNFIRTR